MHRLRSILLLMGLVLLAACAGDPPGAQPYPSPAATDGGASQASPAKPAPAPYILGPGDSINVAVWRFDDLKRTVIVDPSGNIQFPHAGEVRAAGLTPVQLKAELEKRLADYYVSPQVDISVALLRSQVVHVLGEVKTPSTLTMEKRTLAVEAIARAGGYTTEANEDAVLLIRDAEPEPQVYMLQLNLRSPQGSKDRGVSLANNDIIYVPPAKIVDFTRFLTQVVSIVDPFVSVGRAVMVGDQVYKVYRGSSSSSVLVSP